MRELRFTIDRQSEGRRVGRLATSLAGLSETAYRSGKQAQILRLNGEPVHANRRAQAGDTLSVLLPEPAPVRVEALAGLPVVWFDEDLIVLDKPAPLPTMSGRLNDRPSLEGMVKAAFGDFRPVNRLDSGTSGLMLCARTAYAQALAQKMLHTETFVREYLAVTEGCPQEERGQIDAPIGHDPKHVSKRMIRPDGKAAKTDYCVLERQGNRALLRLRLQTGRTHQIRVHLAWAGAPIVGDYLYGKDEEKLPGRFALHSAYLSLRHPLSGEYLTFESDMPPELRDLLRAGD